jgi:small ligand-binding sensory domain FIST
MTTIFWVVMMQFHSFLSTHESTDDAVAQVLSAAASEHVAADAIFVFFTAHHLEDADRVVEKLWLELDPQTAIGCSAEGVIAAEQEIERAPGLALLVATLPRIRLHPFHIGADDWRELLGSPDDMLERMGVGDESRAIIAFGDPFTTPLNQFMPLLDRIAPQAPLVGGMASSAHQPGGNVVVRNDSAYSEGLVGLSLSGALEIQTIVSQGCRPIGQPFVITKSHDNVVEQLGGKPALAALRDTINSLPEQEKALLQQGLLVGRAMTEYRERFGRGDFLVRNIIGVDQKAGSLALADFVKVGQTVQFHVRDAETADEDLRVLLESQVGRDAPAGGLLFSCNGRGTKLFPAADHDIKLARRFMPETPMAGFFAAGEIGPVGGKNFIHGHTASFALFRPRK